MSQKIIYSDNINQNTELKELYENFATEYSIEITKGNLFISERILKDGIIISPEKPHGIITEIIPLKSESELETKLSIKNENLGFRIYKTKEGNSIEVDYKRSPLP